MIAASVYQPKRTSPTSFGLVVLLHGAAIAALVMAKMEVPVLPEFPTTVVDSIPIKPPPEPVRPEPVRTLPQSPVRHFEPLVPPPPRSDDTVISTETTTVTYVDSGPAQLTAEPVRDPPRITEPVRRDARLDPRSELKPPYPRAQVIEGNEGSVTVRVTIGADGRVRAAEKVRATNDDFFQATLRHALRNWRFKPATLDGRPIETSKVMTVHFTLDG